MSIIRTTFFPMALLLFVLLAWQGRQEKPLIYDDAFYVLLAQSIHDGGYRAVWDPDMARPRFPPGYPTALAGLRSLGFDSTKAFQVFNCLAMAAGLAALFFFLGPGPWRAATVCLSALSPLTLAYSTEVMSEALYVALSFAALWNAQKFFDKQSPGLFTVALGFCLASAMTRTIGWTLPGAFLITLMKRRHKTYFMAGLVFSAFAAASFHHLTRTGEYVSLWSPLAQGKSFLVNAARNGAALAGRDALDFISGFWTTAVARSTSSAPVFYIKTAVSLLISGLMGWGLALGVKTRGWRMSDFYLSGYMAVCLAWEVYRFDQRFLLPVYPLLLMALFNAVGQWRPWAAGRVWLAAFPLVLLCLSRWLLYPPLRQPLEKEKEFLAACHWAQKNTPEDALIYSPAPGGVYLHANRHSLKPSDPRRARSWFPRPEYVLWDDLFAEENKKFRDEMAPRLDHAAEVRFKGFALQRILP